ncbi:hypothetical protein X943_001645 [Babesia divergens]|uniref:Guanylate-binding protein N-terminal domain-containing protein n=1 Tax=Babesia divergens TaxID=32595 RepID=A0AAD9GH89_BABDI|nr:hypothetical protein X943_001645 [Babesia divergens]
MGSHTSDEVVTSAQHEASDGQPSDEQHMMGGDMHQQRDNVPSEPADAGVSGSVAYGEDLELQYSTATSHTNYTDVAPPATQGTYAHVSHFQVPQNYMDSNRPFNATSGPPTFGDSDRAQNQTSPDGSFQSGVFSGLSNNYVVIRNVGLNSQKATVSFGYDEPQQPTQPYQDAIEAVNYYRPEPAHDRCVDNRMLPTHGAGGTAYSSIVSNMGGDTTTSLNSSCIDNEFEKATAGHFGIDEGDSPIASSTGGRRALSRLGRMSRRSNKRAPRESGAVLYSDDDSRDDGMVSVVSDGLFEVPLNVCSMSRIIDPFKGFSKIHTNRAIKLLNFAQRGGRIVCSLESNACKLIQNRIKDHKVVAISVCGDSRSGKSYLASMLVNQPVKSFRCSEAYSPSETMNNMHGPAEGAVWVYVGIYEGKFAYLYLDFEGFEHHQQQRISMMTFAFLVSNCVICNIANPARTGIYDAVRTMINVTKAESPILGHDERSLDMDRTIEEFKRKTSFFLNKNSSLTKTFEAVDSELTEEESDAKSQIEDSELWNAPIVHFVFRDCDGHVKCIDERAYTPETLVEQGIFDHYTNIFNCNRKDRAIDFKNDMLDAFEVFANRKYTTLPCPVAVPGAMNMISRSAASNAKDALKRIFATILAPANADIMSTDVGDSSAGRFLGAYAADGQPALMTIPSNLLNPQFCERLDDVKVCIYQDTLSHAQRDIQLNGRMFMNYLKLLVTHFNMHGELKLKDATAMLRDVHLKENESISKEVIVQFLKGIKHNVVMHLPMEPRELISKCMRLKQKSLQVFQTRVFGTPKQYQEPCDMLEKSLDNIIERLEGKNDKIAVDTATAMFEKCAKALEEKISVEAYTYEELLVDIAKMRKVFLQKFKGHSQVTEKVFPQLSQRLYRTFDDYHPKSPAPNIAELSKRYSDE